MIDNLVSNLVQCRGAESAGTLQSAFEEPEGEQDQVNLESVVDRDGRRVVFNPYGKDPRLAQL